MVCRASVYVLARTSNDICGGGDCCSSLEFARDTEYVAQRLRWTVSEAKTGNTSTIVETRCLHVD